MAMMLSGVLMLRHLGETEAADRVESAIAQVIAEGETVTYDMKPDRNDSGEGVCRCSAGGHHRRDASREGAGYPTERADPEL